MLILKAYDQIGKAGHGHEAWLLFKPYLLDRAFLEAIRHVDLYHSAATNIHILSTIDLLMEAHELTLPSTTLPNPMSNTHSRLLDMLSEGMSDPTLPSSSAQAIFPFGVRLDYNIWECISVYEDALLKLKGEQSQRSRLNGVAVQITQCHLLDLIKCILESRRRGSYRAVS